MVGRGVEVLIAFARGVRECGQQLARRILVGVDAARTRQQIEAEIALATERVSVVIDVVVGRIGLILLLAEQPPDKTLCRTIIAWLLPPAPALQFPSAPPAPYPLP